MNSSHLANGRHLDFSPGAVVFDLDGTLVDTLPDMLRALNRALAAHDVPPVNPEGMRAATNEGLAGMAAEALRQYERATALHPSVLSAFEDAYARDLCVDSKPYPGAGSLLKELTRRGVRCAVCTNKHESLASELLRRLGLTEYISAIVGGDTTELRKPAALPLLHALETIGATPNASLLVGDSEVDLACGRNANVPVLLVGHGYAADRRLYDRHPTATDLGHVLDLISSAAGRAEA